MNSRKYDIVQDLKVFKVLQVLKVLKVFRVYTKCIQRVSQDIGVAQSLESL